MPDLTRVNYEVRDRVATITLNEPDRLNPIGHGPGSMEDEILQALELADRDPDVRVSVITGAGRAFSAGGNMGLAPMDTTMQWMGFLENTDRANERIRANRKPTIGAINGICYGAGLILATHLDLLVASEDARFGLIETRFGAGGVETLTYLVGPQWAKFLALTGELITAEKAKEIGLVLEVVAADAFQASIDDLARRVAALPHDAVVINRRIVNATLSAMGWSTMKEIAVALNTVANGVVHLATSADGRVLADVLANEGWHAYKEARDAAFKEPWLGT